MLRPAVIAFALAATACASAPGALRGEFARLEPTEAARLEAVGETVRWGGRIVAVENFADRSCFKVLGVPLTGGARPADQDHSHGRFIACRAGFYDPEVFKAGREITITGRIESIQDGRIGELEYRYPRLAADVIFLWPERREVDVIVERSPFYW